MKKLLLALLLAIVSSSAVAEWVYIVENKTTGASYYINSDIIRKSSNKVKVWELVDLNKAVNSIDKKYISAKLHTEYDCKEEQTRILYSVLYTGNMGKGEIIRSYYTSEKWSPIVPDSVGTPLLKYACWGK
ncbi:MAG: hypothetical protein E2O81_03680 [Betaproteobacteria bacterium]|nr:MAG: hypothetical protein E2O81_03680 [Betaproteobacteria bacterium]TDI79953.1 MAG: hypothetical protein E2O80_07715 [Betaproteobacteria bacterium]